MTRVAILTEIIAPYRVPVFNALARCSAIDPHIIFLSETDPSLREWHVYRDEIEFSYDVLPSWRRRIAGYNFLLNWGLERQLEAVSPDILICGGYNYVASWQAARWCNQHGVPLVLWTESTARDLRNTHLAVEYLKKRFLRSCRACVAAGRSALEYLVSLQFPEHDIVLAPDAVDNEFFAKASADVRKEPAFHRQKYQLPDRYFLYVGRLVPEKGVFDALEAYAMLSPELRSVVSLVFAGNGDSKWELERRAKVIRPGRVQFSGFVQREALPAFYALADALIFPTHSDPWGLVVNEAMACGLPIIATRVAGCAADLVRDGENGFLVPVGATGELSSPMARIACDSELRMRFGVRSSERIRSNSPEACARGLAEAACFAVGKVMRG